MDLNHYQLLVRELAIRELRIQDNDERIRSADRVLNLFQQVSDTADLLLEDKKQRIERYEAEIEVNSEIIRIKKNFIKEVREIIENFKAQKNRKNLTEKQESSGPNVAQNEK